MAKFADFFFVQQLCPRRHSSVSYMSIVRLPIFMVLCRVLTILFFFRNELAVSTIHASNGVKLGRESVDSQRASHSPAKATGTAVAIMKDNNSGIANNRRSSDSDLSITPKGKPV